MRLFISWLVASQSFASLHFALSMISTCASKTFKPVMPHESTISTYMRYSFAVLSKFACAIFNFKINFLFVCSYRSWSGRGWPIFSMVDILFSRWVFIHLSLHKSKAKVLRMPNPEMKKWIYFMLSNNKFLGKCWYGRHPWIRLAMESERKVEKGITFIFCLGTAYGISSMESVGNSESFSLVGWIHLPKCFLSLIFRFELWHLYKSLFLSAKGLSFTYAIFIFLKLSLHLLL